MPRTKAQLIGELAQQLHCLSTAQVHQQLSFADFGLLYGMHCVCQAAMTDVSGCAQSLRCLFKRVIARHSRKGGTLVAYPIEFL